MTSPSNKTNAGAKRKTRKVPKWKEPSQALIEVFRKVAGCPGVEQRKMFGSPVAFINGNMFFSVHQNNLVVRLPKDQRELLISGGEAKPFCPVPGMTMKEYLSFDESGVTELVGAQLFQDSFAYAVRLPPKKKRSPKKRTNVQSKSRFAGSNHQMRSRT